MKKLIFLFFLLPVHNLLAQISIEAGTGVQLTKFKGDLWNPLVNDYTPINEVQFSMNLIFSGNVPIRYIKEEVVMGANPNISVTLFNNIIGVDVPLYGTIKVGAGSSENSTANVGAGLGVGGQFSWFSTKLYPGNSALNYSAVFIVPSVMGEVSFINGMGNLFQIRFEATPIPVSKNTEKYWGEISQLNLRLLRSF